MNEETIVISDNIQRDLREFKNQFNEYISKIKPYGIIELKNGNILRFYSNKNLVGIRRYRYYKEIYNDYLGYQNKQLQQERDKYKSIVDELKKFAGEEISKISKNCGIRTYSNKISPYGKILNKIEELEEGENND